MKNAYQSIQKKSFNMAKTKKSVFKVAKKATKISGSKPKKNLSKKKAAKKLTRKEEAIQYLKRKRNIRVKTLLLVNSYTLQVTRNDIIAAGGSCPGSTCTASNGTKWNCPPDGGTCTLL